MSNDKKPMSDRERERRAKQAAEQAARAQGAGGKFPGQSTQQGGYHPATTVARHIKKTGRGT